MMLQDRRNDYDVTNTVQVSEPAAVRDAVRELFAGTYPGASFDKLWLAFYDFERLFTGSLPGYSGCDTTYHDIQHTLDMSLALARLVVGYERTVKAGERLGPKRAQMVIITALFHDSGYIRHEQRDREYRNGAEFTLYHVTRSADFLRAYLPTLGLKGDVAVSSVIVHYTGYEMELDNIELDDPRDSICGQMLGTADLIAQIADRCYLEKCRDRLYCEFVVGGLAVENARPGEFMVRYESGVDLLRQTPMFYEQFARKRLDTKFGSAYRYMEPVFDGANPYLEAMQNNMEHLARVIESDDWGQLRRNPPCFVSDEKAEININKMMRRQLESVEVAARRTALPKLATG